MTLSYEETIEALRSGVVGSVDERAVILASGPDARTFLQGQLSQDLDHLGSGESIDALVLSPQGKLEAYVRVSGLSEDVLAIDVEGGWGEALYERLRRFRLRVKVTLELESWQIGELRGPKSEEVAAPGLRDGGIAIAVRWPGLAGIDVLERDLQLPGHILVGDKSALEIARIEAGWPRMGLELTERTIAQEVESVVERAVSFTKGCYTGQELIARLDSRGSRVPYRLHGFRAAPGGAPVLKAGDELLSGERRVATVTSVAYEPSGAAVGLCYLRREIEAPVRLGVAGSPDADIEVRALPTK